MPVSEQRDVAISRANFGNHAINAGRSLLRRFAPGTAIVKNRPTRSCELNLFGREPLVFAVVPFPQVWLYSGRLSKSRQLAGFARSLERTAQDQSKFLPRQHRPQQSRGFSPLLGKRHIGDAGMFAAAAPFGFAVADQINFLRFVNPSFTSGSNAARFTAAAQTLCLRFTIGFRGRGGDIRSANTPRGRIENPPLQFTNLHLRCLCVLCGQSPSFILPR